MSTLSTCAFLLFLPSALLSGWKNFFPFGSWLSILVRLPIAALLAFLGVSALARTICRLFPVRIDASAGIAGHSVSKLQALGRPYGLLCITVLGLFVPFTLAFFPLPIQLLIGTSLLAAALRRSYTLRLLKQKNFFLFLRRFGSFREQLVLGEVLAAVPQGFPVLVLVSPAFEPASWDLLVIAWKGVARWDSLQGGPFYVQADDSCWLPVVENLVSSARMVVMDLSEFTRHIGSEYHVLTERKTPAQVVLVADETGDLDQTEDTLFKEWGKQCDQRQKEVDERHAMELSRRPRHKIDRMFLIQRLAQGTMEILNPPWPLYLRMYGRSQFRGILRGLLTLFLWVMPTIIWVYLLLSLLQRHSEWPITWPLWVSILLMTALRISLNWPFYFRRSVDRTLRHVLKESFRLLPPPV